MILKCDNCGDIEYVLVDGYHFGDRLLESVMFMVKDNNGEPQVMGVTDDCKEYFSDLNQKKWLKECEKFCKDLDIATCPHCQSDVGVWGADMDDGTIPTIIGQHKPLPFPDKPINEITQSEAKEVMDAIFEGCPTIDEMTELPIYKDIKESVDVLRKEKKP